MAVWSSLSRSLIASSAIRSGLLNSAPSKIGQNALQIRNMSGGHGPKTLFITPSRFQWHKFKDMLHFYTMLGVIPILGIVFYINVFVGPATLSEVPADYSPKHWEYHRHPITRFLARYFYPSPQQEYEKLCHYLYVENEKAQMRRLEEQIKAKMAERNDYQVYYYRPAVAKYHRQAKEAADYLQSIHGD